MIRVATAFIVVCMVLIAAALGVGLHAVAGLDPARASLAGLAALAILTLPYAMLMRLRAGDGVDGAQLAELSRGVGDLARQVADFGRRLAAAEQRVIAADIESQQRAETLAGEIGELGTLVRQLAVAVAEHDDVLSGFGGAPAAVNDDGAAAAPAPDGRFDLALPPPSVPPPADAAVRAALAGALEDNRIDIHLQPLVTLPQRKLRFYEAVARLRAADGTVFAAERFIPIAEAMGLIGRIDVLMAKRAIQVLRRLIAGNQDIGLFCNVAAATLADPAAFAAYLEVLETHRALASALVLEFRHDVLRGLDPVERKRLGTLAGHGYRLSVDHVGDLRLKPRELAEHGVRFVKVPAALLLDERHGSAADIHPADLADLLSRFGIDLIAERIEDDRTVVDLLDYEVRLGQGNLFSPPRPLRRDKDQGAAAAARDGGGHKPSEPAPPARSAAAAALRRAIGGRGQPRP